GPAGEPRRLDDPPAAELEHRFHGVVMEPPRELHPVTGDLQVSKDALALRVLRDRTPILAVPERGAQGNGELALGDAPVDPTARAHRGKLTKVRRFAARVGAHEPFPLDTRAP